MSDLEKPKLLLNLYSSLTQIESQLDSILATSERFIKAEVQSQEDTDTYLRLTQAIAHDLNCLRVATMNAKAAYRQYRQLCLPLSNSPHPDLNREGRIRTVRYAIAVQPWENGYHGYCFDLPECTATGETIESVKQQLGRTLASSLNRMVNNGEAIPLPLTIIDDVEVKMSRS